MAFAERLWARLFSWRSRAWLRVLTRSPYVLGAGFALAAVVTIGCVVLASSPPRGELGQATRLVLAALGVNFGLLLGLAWLVVLRVRRLSEADDAGSRLHLRFIALFSLAAVAPAIVLALFFGVLVNRGVENWFSDRVQTVVRNSATVANSYVEEQKSYIQDHVSLMAGDLNAAAPRLAASPVTFGRFLAYQASYHAFPAVYLIDRDGRILARAEAENPPAFLSPPPTSFKVADEGDITLRPFESANLFRALYKLKAFPDAYLYVVRPVDPGILNHLRESSAELTAYKDAAANRGRVQFAFGLSYAETVMLVLVGAVWVAITAATAIAAPVARLIQAAGKVSAGDLNTRVEVDRGPEEIKALTSAFNAMTADLQDQQTALRAASRDAESRRQFIETVLSGVSAGVMGLDARMRVSALNLRAAALLDIEPDETLGQGLAQAAPELEAVAQRAVETGADAEEEIDVVRGSETRRLRVRAGGHSADGLVLTFDDITRLMAAQRNAAWRDVARRIAHEIKNPLTPIQLSAERLRRKYRQEIVGDLETFDRCTDTIIRQVGDIGRMVDEFSAFARMPAPKFAPVDATELLRQAVFAQRVATPDIAVEMEEPAASPELIADGRMIGQALTNLLKNASEAVTARKVEEPELRGRLIARLLDHDGALLFEIEDNGVGLPARDRDRLTEPYVTTREKGTGLGLAIVKRIMEDHGGELTLTDAREGRGARAQMWFPRSSPHPVEGRPADVETV